MPTSSSMPVAQTSRAPRGLPPPSSCATRTDIAWPTPSGIVSIRVSTVIATACPAIATAPSEAISIGSTAKKPPTASSDRPIGSPSASMARSSRTTGAPKSCHNR